MDSFSQEQKQYLQGFMAGVEQRGGKPYAGETFDGEITNDEEEAERDLAEDVHGTPVDDLNKQERIRSAPATASSVCGSSTRSGLRRRGRGRTTCGT